MKARSLRVAGMLWVALFSARAAEVSFVWRTNSEPDLAGYKLYHGPSSRNYTNHVLLGKVSAHTMSNLVTGATYYFALSAFNTNNVESALSAELRYPNAPVLGAITNRTIAEDTIASVPLSIRDVDSPSASLTLSATSSNLALLPISNISFSGTGTNRTMVIAPATNRTGTTAITVTLSDGLLTASRAFVLTVTGVPDPPSISAIADVSTDEDIQTPVISFSVSDPETPLTNLTLRAASDNTTLIPTNRIILNGTNGTRTVRLRSATNQSGSATITLTVSDGALNQSTNFNFTVRPINDPPTLTLITNLSVIEDIQTNIAFTVNDVDSPVNSLQVTAASSNPALIAQTNVLLSGSGGNRTVQLRPTTNASGVAVITLTANDGQASASNSFTVTYLSTNDPPWVSSVPDLTVNKLNPVPPIPFTIWDAETAASALSITLTSSNATLLPTNNMVVSGTGADRTLTLTPVANQIGTSRLSIRVNDGITNTRVFFMFTCTGSNNPPVLTVPGPLAGDAGGAIVVPGIQVTDLDAGTNSLGLTITAANGTLTVDTSITGGAGANQVFGNNSASVTLVARRGPLNVSLTNGLTYTSRPDFIGTETLVVTLSDNGHSGLGGPQTDTETIAIQVAGPSGNSLGRWRAAYFSTADLQDPAREATVWGDLADPDNDGRHNLMEFALGLDPLGSQPQEAALVSQTVNNGGNQYLTLIFNARMIEPLLQYIPEVSPDNATWSATAQRVASTPVNAEFEQVTYQDSVPITSTSARFMRLRVVKNSP